MHLMYSSEVSAIIIIVKYRCYQQKNVKIAENNKQKNIKLSQKEHRIKTLR